MKIEVNQSNTEPWGRLSVEETKLAAERLSGDSFKTWVLLTLNQDGYVWCGDLEPRTFQELADYSYLIPLQGGNYLFRPNGEAGDIDTPAEWGRIAELYNSSSQQDLNYVRDKLKSACLDDRMEDILSYWAEKYHALQELDHSKARNRLKYGLSVVLVWWLWDNFRFQIGDVLEFGKDAKSLRYHDSMFKANIQEGAHKRGLSALPMCEESVVAHWNKNFAAKKFEMPLESVGKILKLRKQGGIL